MNYLTSFLTSFCASCVLIGCLYIICPEGNLSKTVKYILSLVFIVIIISSGTLTFSDIEVEFPNSQVSDGNYQDLQISAARYVYSYTLQAQKINFSEITVCTDKSEDGSIVISKVIIYSDCESEEIIKALGELATDREVEIINE